MNSKEIEKVIDKIFLAGVIWCSDVKNNEPDKAKLTHDSYLNYKKQIITAIEDFKQNGE